MSLIIAATAAAILFSVLPQNLAWRALFFVGLAPATMVDAARTQRDLAEQRLPGELKLEIVPSDDGDTTIVKIVTDDMPYLVDSVTMELNRHGADILLIVHPLLTVHRDAAGAARPSR